MQNKDFLLHYRVFRSARSHRATEMPEGPYHDKKNNIYRKYGVKK